MNTDAREVVNALLLEVVRSPSHRLSLREGHAHALLLDRLRQMAGMPSGASTGTIEVMINSCPWEVSVALITGPRGDRVELSARARSVA